ncbi:MAG: P-loop NTPase [Kiritimatiellales bacterium]
MKLAITGKGGVGKSTLAAVLTLLLTRKGVRVLALDADPDANLAGSLGISPEEQKTIIPIAEQTRLIEERTGAKVRRYGQMFKLNPTVDDIAESFGFNKDGYSLLVLGAVDRGGGGCGCPEGVLIRALVSDLILNKSEALIMDMEAGVEHLGRATARGVDCMLIVVEPGQRSVDCARRIIRMAQEIGIRNMQMVANKVASADEEAFIRQALPELPLLGVIPFDESFGEADRNGCSPLDLLPSKLMAAFSSILTRFEEGVKS